MVAQPTQPRHESDESSFAHAPIVVFDDVTFEAHETGRHPECPARLQSIRSRLAACGGFDRSRRGGCRKATATELERIHPRSYLQHLNGFSGTVRVEPDTVMCPQSFEVAVRAAGTACAAVDDVCSGAAAGALCLIRPPGHHALADRAMGFCLINNVAVAAAHALAAHDLDRVLIVDWDVHHGNGTQDIFYESERVAFLSTHRFPFYPGSGAANETGAGPGLGATRNVPLPYGVSQAEFHAAFASALEEMVGRFQPQLIMISAGFDAHHLDPIGSLGLESDDFTQLTRCVVDAARGCCDGRVVSLLEGGYHLEALAESVECHLEALIAESS